MDISSGFFKLFVSTEELALDWIALNSPFSPGSDSRRLFREKSDPFSAKVWDALKVPITFTNPTDIPTFVIFSPEAAKSTDSIA